MIPTKHRVPNAYILKPDCMKAQKMWREGYSKCEIAKLFGIITSALEWSMKNAQVEFGERDKVPTPKKLRKTSMSVFSQANHWKRTIILPPKKEIFVPWSHRR